MTFSNKIDNILNRGIDLHDSDIHNWALTKSQLLEILEKFLDAKIAIAGGDVMNSINGQIGFSGANWYCDKKEDEHYDDFVIRSINETREYILKYPTSDVDYFILVPW
ncbi:MAG TPA: Imm40 family immunity protein [Flavipsychrobacter sp.]|nr:Imm40 family immunity protein [Flavipsychrobacter sp.]